MAKTAIVNKETGVVVGVTTGSEALNKMVLEGAGLTAEQVELVTAKNFQPSEKYPTFKDMTLTDADREEAAKKAQEKADAEAKKASDKAAKDAEKAKKAEERAAAKAAKGEGSTRNTVPLEGEYHIIKAFPATRADHPKMPIWEAIANNSTVEAAKEACPKENPKRRANGVYTFNSEFRYFLKAGYVGMGSAPAAEGAAAA